MVEQQTLESADSAGGGQ